MKKWMNVCREYVGKKFVQVKGESENDTLFICKVTKGKMGMTLQMNLQMFTHWVT